MPARPALPAGNVARAAADDGVGADEWQLVIFHQEQHHAVAELHALRLRHLHLAQWRRLDLAIVIDLRTGHAGGEERDAEQRSHSASFFGVRTAGRDDSSIAVVRLVGVNVALATRRMSAALTLSSLSTSRNSSRQSP